VNLKLAAHTTNIFSVLPEDSGNISCTTSPLKILDSWLPSSRPVSNRSEHAHGFARGTSLVRFSHCSVFHQRNVKGEKSGSEQSNNRWAPKNSW
jgi:hypothetical protein